MSRGMHTVLGGPPCDDNQEACAYKRRSQEKRGPGWLGTMKGEKEDTWKAKNPWGKTPASRRLFSVNMEGNR